MKNIRKFIFFILIICSFSFSFGEASYYIDTLKIEAKINTDGSVDIKEFVLYNANKINGILYNIDYKGYGELKNLQVLFENKGKFYIAKNNDSEKIGSYQLKINDGLAKIKLFFPLHHKKNWFLFKYTLPAGITVYNDIAQFNRKMVGKGWQNNIDNVEIRVTLPQKVDKEKLHAFGHGDLSGNIDIISSNEILYTLKNYNSGDFIETNILFPKTILNKINPLCVKNEDGYEKIMKMEKKLADKANFVRKLASMKGGLKILFFFAYLLWLGFILIFAYLKNGKKYKVNNEYGEYFRELPDSLSPPAAGTAVNRRTTPQHLFAMIMDLVRKNIFEMIEDKEKNITILRKNNFDSTKLSDAENFVIDWYIEELGDGTQVILEDINSYVRTRKNAITFGKNYEKWLSLIDKELKNAGYVLEKPSRIPIILGVFTILFSFFFTFLAIKYFRDERFVICIFLSFITFTFVSNKRRYSLEAEKIRNRWLAFKKFLVDYSNLEEANLSSIYLWEHYFVYAIALGVAEKVAENYKKLNIYSSNNSLDNRLPLMIMYHNNNQAFRNLERVTTNAVKTSSNTLANSRRSSGTGHGGGFSGGSSGGGGSRGGGGAF